MKKLLLCFCLLAAHSAFAQNNNPLFDNINVHTIEVYLPEDSFQYMYNNLINTYYTPATFIYKYGNNSDTVAHAGLRLRGNTSLSAQKKSFKISFNEFNQPDEPGEYQGVRKLNLRGSHNDPSLQRERLFYHVWNQAGMPERRSAFVNLYINNVYYGVYTNMEEIDKKWLDRVFGNNEGNLYKCQWPASLAYLGNTEQAYKNVMHNDTERAYELQTNEVEDDYSRFVQMVTALNAPVNSSYTTNLEQILNVESVLKAFALDVASGNWDDYFYNQNNYYLYDNPATGKFEFITLDTDNTFGVDWVNRDWATRDALDWYSHSGSRPLATQLMQVPEYQQQFIDFLHYVTQNITKPSVIFPLIEARHAQLIPHAALDYYRTLDYGYDMNDFHNSITQTVDGHTPYGIKPFLEKRRDFTLQQLAGLVGAPEPDNTTTTLSVWPNPTADKVQVDNTAQQIQWITVTDLLGHVVQTYTVENSGNAACTLSLQQQPNGLYILSSNIGSQLIRVQH